MSINPDEVRVAGAGHVWAAPAGTALPTDSTGTLTADYVDLGFVNTDGVSFSFNREVEDLDAWQGSKLRVLSTSEPASVSFALMQTSDQTLPVALGGGTITEETEGEYKYVPPAKGTNTERVIVVEFNDGEDIHYRYCLPRTQLEGEVTFTLQKGEALTYPLTFGVLDAEPKFTILTDDPAWDVATS